MRPSRELGRLSAPCPRVFAACVAVNHHQASCEDRPEHYITPHYITLHYIKVHFVHTRPSRHNADTS